MKKSVIRFLSLLVAVTVNLFVLSACSNDAPKVDTPQIDAPQIDTKPVRQGVKHVGVLPETFRKIVDDDLFNRVTYNGGRLFEIDEIIDEEKRSTTCTIKMYDFNGNELFGHTNACTEIYDVKCVTATSDGGYLYVLGYSERKNKDGTNASGFGGVSRIIKIDASGNVKYDVACEGLYSESLEICIEKNGNFYFFGEIDRDKKDAEQYPDIYMTAVDKEGNIKSSKRLEGEKNDYFLDVELIDGNFIIYIDSRSNAGDYRGLHHTSAPTYWMFTVDDNFNIIHREIISERKNSDFNFIGELNGNPVYRTDEFLKDYDAGYPTLCLDYGDYYMIVSTNETGYYENQPPIYSSRWCYTETVYSGFDKNGNLLFRTAVDSSRDFDKMAEEYYSKTSK